MTVGGHRLPHPSVQDHPQTSGQNLDLLAQSLQAAGGVLQDHPTSSTSVLDSSGAIDDDMGLDPHRQLSPPADDQQVYSPISPPARNVSSRQAPASSRDLHTPNPQVNRSNSSSDTGTSSTSSASSNRSAQKPSSRRECFQLVAEDADAILPQLGEFQNYSVDPAATTARVTALLTAISTNLHELGQIGLSKSEVEEQYSKSVTALVDQRTVVRNFRDRAFRICEFYDDSDENLRELEMNQLKLTISQHELSISQLKATLASKDAEIKLLTEQLRRATESTLRSPKGKALANSKNPYFKRSSLPSKDVMRASLNTPRPDYQY